MISFSDSDTEDRVFRVTECLSRELLRRNLSIATVESCTGGALAALFTELPGSSAWFERGFVTYSNRAKMEMAGVQAETLESFGAVSEQVALEMAQGGILRSEANCALAITGIAGPSGGSVAKPVGTVCFGWAGFTSESLSETRIFSGDRRSVREQSVAFSVYKALKLMDINSSD